MTSPLSAFALDLFGFSLYTFPAGAVGAICFHDPLEGTEMTAPETKSGGGPRKPPGPRSLSPLGSAPAFARDIEGFSLRMWQRYGDLVRARFLLWPGYLLYHPDSVKYVLHDHHR